MNRHRSDVILLFVTMLATTLVAVFPAHAHAAGAKFKLRAVTGSVLDPTWVGSPRGDKRLFVTERRGRILVWVNGKRKVFLDLRSRVEDSGDEQGLLGVAFHPNFASNHRFFVYYTIANGDARVVRFRARSNHGVGSSAKRILSIDLNESESNHNGGSLAFDTEGMLLIGVGDGGGAGDPDGVGQDRTTLRAKLLRINVDSGSPYSIPSSNPYGEASGYRREIYAIGLRNPWRFSVDRTTGDIHIGDVGQGDWEEVDRLPAGDPAGANFGWGRFEGNAVFNAAVALASGTTHRKPVRVFGHDTGACSVIGGVVYRGTRVPKLRGTYLYADFCSSWIRGFKGTGWGSINQSVTVPNIVAFGEGPRRDVYVASYSTGRVYRIVKP